MIQRTNKIFIGKDISRTAAVSAGIGSEHFTLSSHIVDGEIVVLDKYKRVLTDGATVSDTDVIYICQGTNKTFDFTTESTGTAVSASVKCLYSDPIEGKRVKSYSGIAYAVATQQVTTITVSGLTPVTGTEYLIRVVYKDIWEHPGQFTATYRYIATNATLATFTAGFVAKINKHSGRRVQATESSAVSIILTGKTIPECTSTLYDIDRFTMVEFKAFLDYVSTASAGSIAKWTSFGATVTTTAASYGSGMWEQVRDIEKDQQAYRGITNRTHFPILLPDMQTVVSATYNIITIEHDKSYLSPDNQYIKDAPLTTQIAFVVPTTGTQQITVVGQLNTWMESLPQGFKSVTF